MNPTRTRLLVYLTAASATVPATVLILLLSHFQHVPNISLIYVPVVLGCATYFGLGPAVIASTLCVAEYDFFLLEPRLNLTVNRFQDVLALVVLCVVAAVAARLASSSRSRARAAEERASEGAMLNELSEALITAEEPAEVLLGIAELVVRLFHAQSCSVLLPQADGTLQRAAGAGPELAEYDSERVPMAAASHSFRSALEVSVPVERRGIMAQSGIAQYVPLRGPEGVVGVMEVLWRASRQPGAAESRLLSSFSTQAALAIDRARSVEERRRARILEETDRLKSSLLSAVSHDLRTPLASIKASVTSLLLADREWPPDEQRELLDAIDEEADRLNRLVGNVLDVSRIESGALKPLLDWYDIHELVDSAAAEASRHAGGRPVEVIVSSPMPLVEVDLVLVRQALVNLLENAARYSPTNTPIILRADHADGLLTMEVEDHGEGVPPDRRSRVFAPFVRARQHGDSEHGVGLGLAICRGVAVAHGGEISVRETSGGGATFTLRLPQSAAPQPVLAVT